MRIFWRNVWIESLKEFLDKSLEKSQEASPMKFLDESQLPTRKGEIFRGILKTIPGGTTVKHSGGVLARIAERTAGEIACGILAEEFFMKGQQKLLMEFHDKFLEESLDGISEGSISVVQLSF